MMTEHHDISFQPELQEHSLKKSRKQRKDAGQLRWENRDYYCLQWIGQQTVVRFDQLQRLLGRESQAFHDYSHVLSPSATRNAINRWEMGKLINSRHVQGNEQKYYWLSQQGLDFVELNLPHHVPEASTIQHSFACNQIRFYVEQLDYETEEMTNASWLSQRELRLQERTIPLPDAEWYTLELGRVAIHVETERKVREQALHTMQSYAQERVGSYSEVWYFATHTTLAFLEDLRQTLQQSGIYTDKLYIYDAEKIIFAPSLSQRTRKNQ